MKQPLTASAMGSASIERAWQGKLFWEKISGRDTADIFFFVGLPCGACDNASPGGGGRGEMNVYVF